ncbi:hypothetical protein SAMN05216266_104100 [Amycolatopsis marina]|uniref:Heavy-metal-associated domain-containing protein n=1 Tax=Amycolatopsis marina TaxID=490629 RepID=A0A1I0XY32_9PSEU|nr:hypothetical protein [Amycolatopsis marina]SFB05824.1 hypothetical protein SAMN05216266_104100 [Amycolatopsis marina]
MNTAIKLSAYGVALVLVAGGAMAIGSAVGPFTGTAGALGAEDAARGDDHSDTVAGAEQNQPGGLASSRGGYTLTPTRTTLEPGANQPFTFRVLGPDGRPVTGFDVEHEKRMHLIVVRRDTAEFQHVHPTMAADGTWTVPLSVPMAGSYRAFADFAPTGGDAVTLGVDLAVPGDFRPVDHKPSATANVDGYQVRLSGDLVPGQSSPVTATVTRNGRVVTDLRPYLGAYGHLVALRAGDLAYLHVHPDGVPGDGRTAAGPGVTFHAEVPSAGTYRLFLDFRHEGEVRTAEFTVSTADASRVPAPQVTSQDADGEGGDGHGHG